MAELGFGDLSPVVRSLTVPLPLCELGLAAPQEASRAALDRLSPQTLVAPGSLADESAAQACLAGLWLLHDWYEDSHRVSQDLPTAEGSFWHGILHRREPDPDNAKYWFRQVGPHVVFGLLLAAAQELATQSQAAQSPVSAAVRKLAGKSSWDPFAFVDLCEAARGTGTVDEAFCRQVQQREWKLLFEHCYRAARG